jgi:head-tail adaptor
VAALARFIAFIVALLGGSRMAKGVQRIGDLRDRVRVERRGRLPTGQDIDWDDTEQNWEEGDAWLSDDGDGAGNYETTWLPLIQSRRARIQATSGSEQVIAGRLAGVEAFDIWLRRDVETAKIRPGDRVIDARDEARIFNIRWAGSIDAHTQFVLLQCQAGAAD